MNSWWGYRHTEGSLQVKRFFTNEDLVEARSSPFVAAVTGVFQARDRAHALEIAGKQV